MKLTRIFYGESGVFGTLAFGPMQASPLYTLEHSYGDEWQPKLPPGSYICRRGRHQLHSGPIETFEVTGVPGHTGILFHYGNTEDASEGCILLGTRREGDAVLNSRAAFREFMEVMFGLDEFTLEVV